MKKSYLPRFLDAPALICIGTLLAACTMGSPPTARTGTDTQPVQSAQVPPPIANAVDRYWPVSRIDEMVPRLP
jgi:hypothetical protein